MIMAEFKVGDKVRCVKVGLRYITEDCIYEIRYARGRIYHVIADNGIRNCYPASVFELVEPNPVLTPEEVFEHLRKGTKLQCRKTAHLKWCDTITGSLVTDNPTFKMITLWNWRIKPEPEVIELNGKRYKLIEE